MNQPKGWAGPVRRDLDERGAGAGEPVPKGHPVEHVPVHRAGAGGAVPHPDGGGLVAGIMAAVDRDRAEVAILPPPGAGPVGTDVGPMGPTPDPVAPRRPRR